MIEWTETYMERPQWGAWVLFIYQGRVCVGRFDSDTFVIDPDAKPDNWGLAQDKREIHFTRISYWAPFKVKS